MSQQFTSSPQLTIYSNSGHMVRQVQPDNRVIPVPKSIDVSSIVALTPDGATVSTGFLPEKSVSESLVKSSVPIHAVVVKRDQRIRGIIVELDATNVTVWAEDGSGVIMIRDYDQVLAGIPVTTTIRKQPLIFIGQVTTPVMISYLFSDVSWTCVGTAVINQSHDSMRLYLAGHVTNNTGEPIDADIFLVSGTVNQRRPRYFAGTTMMAAESSGPSQAVTIGALEEYVRYNLHRLIIEDQVVINLGVMTIPVVKVYQHRVGDEDVYFGYSFDTPDYIPQCLINAYAADAQSGIGSFLGSSQISEHQKGQDVDFILGQTTKVQAQSQVVRVSDTIVTSEIIRQQSLELNEEEQRLTRIPIEEHKLHLVIEELTADISNYNESSVFFGLRYDLRGRRLFRSTCQPADKQKPGMLEWFFKLEPGTRDKPSKAQFDCTITTIGYY